MVDNCLIFFSIQSFFINVRPYTYLVNNNSEKNNTNFIKQNTFNTFAIGV